MTATYPGMLMRKIITPFPANEARLQWDYIPSSRWPLSIDASYNALPAESYRVEKEKSYRIVNGKRESEPNRFRFFVASIRHLLDFVFEMRSADVVQFAGFAKWKQQDYARVYMTWGDPEPSFKMDQYVLWINKRTHLMDRFDCTGRGVLPVIRNPFIVCRVEFEGYRKVNGMQVPSKITVYKAGTQEVVHGYQIHSASYTFEKTLSQRKQ